MRAADVQAVERAMKELLSSLGIVYPLRVRSDKEKGRLHLVLKCRPIKGEAERIRQRLAELLAPLPIRPATTVKMEGGESSAGRPAARSALQPVHGHLPEDIRDPDPRAR